MYYTLLRFHPNNRLPLEDMKELREDMEIDTLLVKRPRIKRAMATIERKK